MEDRALLPDMQTRPANVLILYWTGGEGHSPGHDCHQPLQTQVIRHAVTRAVHALDDTAYIRKMPQAGEAFRGRG